MSQNETPVKVFASSNLPLRQNEPIKSDPSNMLDRNSPFFFFFFLAGKWGGLLPKLFNGSPVSQHDCAVKVFGLSNSPFR